MDRPDADGLFTGTWDRRFYLVIRFGIALLVGWFTVTVLANMLIRWVFSGSHSFGPRSSLLEILLFSLLGMVSGGLVSGWIVMPAIWDRRGRFFYLVASSPAFPYWGIVVLGYLRAGRLGGGGYIRSEIIIICVTALAGILGSLAGHRLHWWWFFRTTGARNSNGGTAIRNSERTGRPEEAA